MRTTLNIQDSVINELLLYYHSKTKTEAVNLALNEFVRNLKIQNLIEMCGKIDIEDNLYELKQLEIKKMKRNE